MSAKLTEIKLSDGSTVAFEYEEVDRDKLKVVNYKKRKSNASEAGVEFQEAIYRILKIITESVLEPIKSHNVGMGVPKSVSFEFGLQLGGEAGIPFVTKGSANANIKITATWELK